MRREDELALLRRCAALAAAGQTQLAEQGGEAPVAQYLDAGRFARERDTLFRRLPILLAPVAALADAGSYRVFRSPLGELLVCRDDSGQLRAFHNVCRHRGMQLVAEPSGRRERFVCPYHAWTYATTGALVGVPHGEAAFPDLDRACSGLVPVEVEQRHGLLWALPQALSLEAYLTGLGADLDWLGLGALTIFAEDVQVWHANWKLIGEGGLESYHFRQAHRRTIAPFFFDNLSVYDRFGPHFRSVLPRRSLTELDGMAPASWSLRAHSHLTYALFPGATLLVQADHVAWIQALPLAAGRTEIAVRTLVPADAVDDEAVAKHWQTNHQITCATLREDFEIAERIQQGLASGANAVLRFGRNEGALSEFQQVVETQLAAGEETG